MDLAMSGSRMRRPNLYLTIVAIYLLTSCVIFLSAVGYFLYYSSSGCNVSNGYCSNGPGLGIGGGLLILGAGFGGFLVLGVPSVIGSIFLMQKNKKGAYFSLASLIMWIFFPLMLLLMGIYSIHTADEFMKNLSYYAIELSWLTSSAIMLAFLIKGKKHIVWE